MIQLLDLSVQVVWPNHTDYYTHHKHRRQQAWHTHGVQKQTLMNVVDNSTLGRQAMAEGKPPRVSYWDSQYYEICDSYPFSGHPCLCKEAPTVEARCLWQAWGQGDGGCHGPKEERHHSWSEAEAVA